MDKIVSLSILQSARFMELSAVYQYMSTHYALENCNMPGLAREAKKIAIEEMRHAEEFGLRIRELDGVVEPSSTLGTAGIPAAITTAEEYGNLYYTARRLEEETLTAYTAYIEQLEASGDRVTAQIFKKIILSENEHLQYFTDIGRSIVQFGAQFLAAQSGSAMVGE